MGGFYGLTMGHITSRHQSGNLELSVSSLQHLCSLRTPHCLVSPTLPAFLERAHISVNQEANSASRPCHALGLGIGENCWRPGWGGGGNSHPFLPPDYRRASFLPCPLSLPHIGLCTSLSLPKFLETSVQRCKAGRLPKPNHLHLCEFTYVCLQKIIPPLGCLIVYFLQQKERVRHHRTPPECQPLFQHDLRQGEQQRGQKGLREGAPSVSHEEAAVSVGSQPFSAVALESSMLYK